MFYTSQKVRLLTVLLGPPRGWPALGEAHSAMPTFLSWAKAHSYIRLEILFVFYYFFLFIGINFEAKWFQLFKTLTQQKALRTLNPLRRQQIDFLVLVFLRESELSNPSAWFSNHLKCTFVKSVYVQPRFSLGFGLQGILFDLRRRFYDRWLVSIAWPKM